MSSKTRKRIFIIALMIVALFGLELGREELVYYYLNSYMEHAYWQIRPGMIKGQVEEVLGPPDRIQKEGGEEVFYWLAREQQGWLWKKTRLDRLKKYYELIVTFNDQGLVTDVSSDIE